MSGIVSAMVQAPAGGAPPGPPTWSSTFKGPFITLSGGDLVATVAGGSFDSVLGTGALSGTGSFDVETDALAAHYLVGVANTGITLSTFVGGSVGGIGLYNDNGTVFLDGGGAGSGPTSVAGDTITVFYDIPGAQVRWAVNGGTPSSWFSISSITGPVYPGGSLLDNGSSLTGVF